MPDSETPGNFGAQWSTVPNWELSWLVYTEVEVPNWEQSSLLAEREDGEAGGVPFRHLARTLAIEGAS
jgi:hypothetical protein